MPLIPHLLHPRAAAAAVGTHAPQLAVPAAHWPQLDETDLLPLASAVCAECNLNADQTAYAALRRGRPAFGVFVWP